MKITKLILAAYLLTSMAACDTDKNIAMYGEDSGAIRIEASIKGRAVSWIFQSVSRPPNEAKSFQTPIR